MAFASAMTFKKELPGGFIEERGTWTATAGTDTGTITADTTVQPELVTITEWYTSNNADNETKVATDAGDNKLKLTFTANDTGTYVIIGKAV